MHSKISSLSMTHGYNIRIVIIEKPLFHFSLRKEREILREINHYVEKYNKVIIMYLLYCREPHGN